MTKYRSSSAGLAANQLFNLTLLQVAYDKTYTQHSTKKYLDRLLKQIQDESPKQNNHYSTKKPTNLPMLCDKYENKLSSWVRNGSCDFVYL